MLYRWYFFLTNALSYIEVIFQSNFAHLWPLHTLPTSQLQNPSKFWAWAGASYLFSSHFTEVELKNVVKIMKTLQWCKVIFIQDNNLVLSYQSSQTIYLQTIKKIQYEK
jgi:hypothetical protein